MIKAAVIDDEPLARELISSYIEKHPDLALIKSYSRASESIELIGSDSVELLFLDIRMPEISGIRFLETLKRPPAVIFTTAYSEFAVKSYELNAVDYLLKPITYVRFLESIKRYQKAAIKNEVPIYYSYFKIRGELIRILHADLILVEAVRDYVLLKTVAKTYITHITMKGLGEMLPKLRFTRVHRSYYVNRDFITKVGSEDLQVAGTILPIGQSFKKSFIDWLRLNDA